MSHDCQLCRCEFPISPSSCAEDILRHHMVVYRLAIDSLREEGTVPEQFAYGDLDSAYWAQVEEEDKRLGDEAAQEDAGRDICPNCGSAGFGVWCEEEYCTMPECRACGWAA